jgi:Tol biopolymer transport system component
MAETVRLTLGPGAQGGACRGLAPRRAAPVALLALAIAAGCATDAYAVPRLERVSLASGNGQGNNSSSHPSITPDGRYVVFESRASNLVPNDTNGKRDIFIRDRFTMRTERLSVSTGGQEANGDCFTPRLSADGRYVAFSSNATNLVPEGSGGPSEIYLHDRVAHTTICASVSNAGAQGNAYNWAPALGREGRYLAFASSSTNLVPDDTNGNSDIFVRDLVAQTTTRVSLSNAGEQPNGRCDYTAISGNGQVVAFTSLATNLVPGLGQAIQRVFTRNLVTQVTSLVSMSNEGVPADNHCEAPSLNNSGQFVAYWSIAANLVPGDTNGVYDAFLYNRLAGTTTRVSVSSSGEQGNDDTWSPVVSDDGTRVAYDSYATNLVPGDTNYNGDVFVHNLTTQETTRISVTSTGTQGNGDSVGPAMDVDGSVITFYSYATNLVPDDTNGAFDVFVWSERDFPFAARWPR